MSLTVIFAIYQIKKYKIIAISRFMLNFAPEITVRILSII